MQKFPWLKLDVDTGDFLVTVHVKTRQHKDELVVSPNQFLIRVTSPPIQGRANKQILKLFRKHFKTETILETGHKSSKKVLRLRNIKEEQILAMIKESLGIDPQVVSD
ncbi:MAG: DUF167 domain-containing protein [Candidatus Heimdallarchaeota archaeon]